MRSKKRNSAALALCLSILLSLAQFSCSNSSTAPDGSGSNTQPSRGESAIAYTGDTKPIEDAEFQSFQQMLGEISSGVGKVGDTKGAASARRFVVFEEKHTSVASQFEIALMLLRLHRHGLRDIVLEGLTDNQKFPDTQWFRSIGTSEDDEVRNEVLVGMLRDGEISAIELIAMAFPDVVVHPGDDAAAYAVELTKRSGSSSTIYLYKIGLKSVRPEHYGRLNELNRQNKVREMVEFVISLDPWAKARYERMKSSTGGDCIEQVLTEYREIEQQAQTVGAELSSEERGAMSEARAFFEAADKRSHTTVKLALGAEPKSPLVALNIGAAHTCGVKRLFGTGPTYAILTPLSHTEAKSAGDLSYESFERKGKLLSVTWTGKGFGSFLDGRRKPGPIVGQDWFKPISQGRVAIVLLLRAYRDKGGPDPDLKRRLDSFGNFRLDWPSVNFKDGELSFKASVIIGQKEKNIWGVAGTPKSAEVPPRRGRKLEEMLLNGLETVKSEPGERKEPPAKPVVEVITPDVVAAFDTEPEALKGFRIRV